MRDIMREIALRSRKEMKLTLLLFVRRELTTAMSVMKKGTMLGIVHPRQVVRVLVLMLQPRHVVLLLSPELRERLVNVPLVLKSPRIATTVELLVTLHAIALSPQRRKLPLEPLLLNVEEELELPV